MQRVPHISYAASQCRISSPLANPCPDTFVGRPPDVRTSVQGVICAEHTRSYESYVRNQPRLPWALARRLYTDGSIFRREGLRRRLRRCRGAEEGLAVVALTVGALFRVFFSGVGFRSFFPEIISGVCFRVFFRPVRPVRPVRPDPFYAKTHVKITFFVRPVRPIRPVRPVEKNWKKTGKTTPARPARPQ